MEDLTSQKCEACRVGAPPVTPQETAQLHPQVPDWRIIEESVSRASTLESGETQLIEEIVPAQYESFKENPAYQVITQDSLGCPHSV